jgi:hypothetical protein
MCHWSPLMRRIDSGACPRVPHLPDRDQRRWTHRPPSHIANINEITAAISSSTWLVRRRMLPKLAPSAYPALPNATAQTAPPAIFSRANAVPVRPTKQALVSGAVKLGLTRWQRTPAAFVPGRRRFEAGGRIPAQRGGVLLSASLLLGEGPDHLLRDCAKFRGGAGRSSDDGGGQHREATSHLLEESVHDPRTRAAAKFYSADGSSHAKNARGAAQRSWG